MLFRTRPNIQDLQLFLQMTNFSLVPRLHQSQPANHRNPRIQTKRLPLSSSVTNPTLIQTKLQKTTLSSTFKITSDNCASSISSSCSHHSSDFKTISVQRANPEAAAKTRGEKLQLHVLPCPSAFPSGQQQWPQKQFRSLSSAHKFSHTGLFTSKYPLTSKLLECAKSSLTQSFYFPFYSMFTLILSI